MRHRQRIPHFLRRDYVLKFNDATEMQTSAKNKTLRCVPRDTMLKIHTEAIAGAVKDKRVERMTRYRADPSSSDTN